MRGSGYSLLRLICFLAVAMLIVGLVAFAAIAQEMRDSRSLDRVEILPPDRRTAPAQASRGDAGAEAERITPLDLPSPPDSETAFQAPSTISPSTLSLVEGKTQVSLGAASLPAQVQTIGSQDIQQLNIWGREPVGLFARTPGVTVRYYNQGIHGLGICMRGFSTANEVGFWVDGVPQNFPSQSGHGRVLIQWLTPEAIDKIEVIKGPFSAMYGDFAMAGVVNIVTKKTASSSIGASGGSYGTFRGLGILSSDTLVPAPFLVQEYYTIDGYRDNSELKEGSTFDKVSFPLLGSTLSLRYSYFQSDWRGPGYVPIDDVKSGQWNRKRALDPWDGGDVWRYEVVANYAPSCGERGLYATLYVDKYHGVRYCRLNLRYSEYARMEDRLYWGRSSVLQHGLWRHGIAHHRR